jgi:hypothetical protein
LLIEQLNVATPLDALSGLEAQVKVAPTPPVPPVIDIVTEAVLAVTVLPPASCMATTGGMPNAVPESSLPGEESSISLEAGPTTTVNGLLVAEVRPGSVAVSV